MAEYAYVPKDESYALKHYGVKGMKWHKHLKRSFDDRIGLTAKRAYDNSDKRADDTLNQFHQVLSAKDPYKARGPVALSRNRNPYSQIGSETTSSSYDASDRYNKYKKTPLGKIERSSKLGKKAVDAYDRADRSIDKALRKRNVKKRKKQGEAYREQVKKDYRQKNRKYNDERIASQYKDRANMAGAVGLAGYRSDGTPIYKKTSRRKYKVAPRKR